MKSKTLVSLILAILSFFPITNLSAQSQKSKDVDLKYISPAPGSKYIMPRNNIALRHGDVLDSRTVKSNLISVKSSKGKSYTGKLVLSDDQRTLIFLPDQPFSLGETVHVSLTRGLKTKSGLNINPVDFHFEITQQIIKVNPELIKKELLVESSKFLKPQNKTACSGQIAKENNYPDGYAYGQVMENNDPPPGYYFYAPHNIDWFPETLPFITIIDKYGIPVYYRKMENEAYDLKLLPNGLLSFYSFAPYWGHIVMDSSYNFVDKYQMGNGYYYTDFHEFRMLENGHTFVMTFDSQLIDMSQIVPGGNPQATVSGFVFQELDTNHNVVFQWRSWDHFEITETGPQVDLLSDHIDYVHGNAIEVESDTSLLISSRNFHEITKIDRNTGDIIWRFGGSQNQFDFGTDSLRFYKQHDSRRIYNNHVTAFDNGNYQPLPKFSSVVEYEIDPVSMTATLINRYRHDPDCFGYAMGNACWTNNESIVVGWGTTTPGITEYDLEGNVLWELYFEAENYRAYRFPWKTNYFIPDTDSLFLGQINYGDSSKVALTILNMQDHDIEITSTNNMTENFGIPEAFPVVIPPAGSKEIMIQFIPDSVGEFHDVITLNSDINTDTLVQRIARQVVVWGDAVHGQGISDNSLVDLLIYPNPVRNKLTIEGNPEFGNSDFEIFDYSGKIMDEGMIPFNASVSLNVKAWPAGIYMIRFINSTGNSGSYKFIKK